MKDDTLVEKSIVGFILLVGKARQGFRGVASGGPDIRRGKSVSVLCQTVSVLTNWDLEEEEVDAHTCCTLACRYKRTHVFKQLMRRIGGRISVAVASSWELA